MRSSCPDSGGLPLGRTGDVGGYGGRVGDAGHGNGLVPGCCRDSVAVVTSGYASFAGDTVPAGRVTLTGILMYGKFGGTREVFALKLRDGNDVEM